MATVTRIGGRCIDLIVALAPSEIRGRLAERIMERLPSQILDRLIQRLIARRPGAVFDHCHHVLWDEVEFPRQASDFEDLAFLFACCPSNRGVIRMDFDEAALLYRIARRSAARRGVEVGRFRGGSTALLSVAMRADGRLLSIDICPDNDALLQATLQRLGTAHKVELLVADANVVQCSEELDFAFIDGDHSYEGAKKDHLKWGKLVKPGGFIVHHDMAKARPFATQLSELQRLRTDILNYQCNDLTLHAETGSLTVFCRVSSSWRVF